MKKLLLALSLIFLFSSSALAAVENNPIDKAFAKHWLKVENTVQEKYLADRELTAWRNELDNAATILKKTFKFAEDKARVDNYVTTYKAAAKAASELEWLFWSNTDVPPSENRSSGTGAPGAMMRTESSILREAALGLIARCELGTETYKYIFVDDIPKNLLK